MNVFDAAYATAHDYPGGTESLAPRLGMSGAILRGKVNTNDIKHHLTLAEAMRMQAITGDTRILHAMSDELGFVCIQAGQFDGVSDEALLDSFTAVVRELGDLSRVFHDSLADGRVTRKEFEKLQSEFYDLQQAGAELMNRVGQMTEQGESKQPVVKAVK